MKGAYTIPLLVVGGDFRMASASWRSAAVLNDDERHELVSALRKDEPDMGFCAIDTCNRTEWVISTRRPAWIGEILRARMLQRWKSSFPDSSLHPEPYVHIGQKAVRHLMRVAVGLESFVMGEAQISGQFNRALERARGEQTSSAYLNRLGIIVGHLVSDSCRAGFQNDQHRGVHGIALDFLKTKFDSGDAQKRVIVYGMGEIGRRMAASVEELTAWKVLRVNRTIDESHARQWYSCERLPELLTDADALVLCSGARQPVLRLAEVVGNIKNRPFITIDLGIPSQLEIDVCTAESFETYALDDLMSIMIQNEPGGKEEVERLLEESVRLFDRYCREGDIVGLLDNTQKRHEMSVKKLIPEFVASNLSALPERERRRVEEQLKGLFRDYANDVFRSIHELYDAEKESK